MGRRSRQDARQHRNLGARENGLDCRRSPEWVHAAGSDFTNPKACEIVPNVNLLVQTVRRAGGLVVFLRHTISDEPRFRLTEWQQRSVPRTPEGDFCFRSGSFSHHLHQDLDVQAGDLLVNKHRYSPFLPNSSDLDATLRERGIDTLIITGTVTNVCCESTARDGNMLGYKIVFVSDATAALTDEEHNATLLSMAAVFGDVRSVSETLRLLQTA
jgi:nicotinamidase-related amidase